MSYSRSFAAETASEDCTGRALWALGTAVHLAGDEGQRLLARQMFERGLRFATELGPRGTALTMLGIASFLTARPEVAPAAALLERSHSGSAVNTATAPPRNGAGSSRRSPTTTPCFPSRCGARS